jgi:hypothetical protein
MFLLVFLNPPQDLPGFAPNFFPYAQRQKRISVFAGELEISGSHPFPPSRPYPLGTCRLNAATNGPSLQPAALLLAKGRIQIETKAINIQKS